jgi:hypothetical protein
MRYTVSSKACQVPNIFCRTGAAGAYGTGFVNLPAFATDGILGSLAEPAMVPNIAWVTGATVAPVMNWKVKKVAED